MSTKVGILYNINIILSVFLIKHTLNKTLGSYFIYNLNFILLVQTLLYRFVCIHFLGFKRNYDNRAFKNIQLNHINYLYVIRFCFLGFS